MNFEKIVTSEKYKEIILEHAGFTNLVFLNNDKNDKNHFLKQSGTSSDKNQNNIITHSFLFMKDSDKSFFLLMNPKTKKFDGIVFSVDNNGVIEFIGTNPFNFITDISKSTLYLPELNREAIVAVSQQHIGFFNWILDSIMLNNAIESLGEYK
jgi:hypothetical protein